ncbi:MAG: glycosyltransferase family 4 protein [Deltaproteobacteria bacterium]|nr:glycosyltransferase family 4 protein [Deltaproteobacteria bacterium]
MKDKWSILHTEASEGWGGQEIRIFTEARGMVRRGHRVMIAAPAYATLYKRSRDAGIPVADVDYNRKSFIKSIRSVLKLIEIHGFHVICTHSSRDSWAAGIAGRLSRRRPLVVRTRHLNIPVGKGFASRSIYRRIPHMIFTTGESIRRLITEGLRFPDERTLSIPTGVDLKRFDPTRPFPDIRHEYGIPPEAFVVGTVAVLRSWKGHAFLLEAAERICASRSDIRFLLVGDGPLREKYTRWVADHGLEERVILTGHQERVPEILNSIDIFALPSYAHEGVPQAVIQAMAMKKAIITCDVGAIGEVIKDGETGRLVPVKDPGALAETILQLGRDKAQREQLAAAAAALARDRLGMETMLDRVEEGYRAGLSLGR